MKWMGKDCSGDVIHSSSLCNDRNQLQDFVSLSLFSLSALELDKNFWRRVELKICRKEVRRAEIRDNIPRLRKE